MGNIKKIINKKLINKNIIKKLLLVRKLLVKKLFVKKLINNLKITDFMNKIFLKYNKTEQKKIRRFKKNIIKIK